MNIHDRRSWILINYNCSMEQMDLDIEDFKVAYQRMCKDHQTEAQDCVIKQISL